MAILLSFTAGMINIAGFLATTRLTTNVTGHFANLIEEINKLDLIRSIKFLLLIFFFFCGSFVSSLIIETISRKNDRYVYVVPIALEALILLLIARFGFRLLVMSPDAVAMILLFAMGLQNSMVSSISNSAVRTTHVTGLFTDLGIELSQLIYYKSIHQRTRLIKSIKLRLYIIGFFFMGGLLSSILYAAAGFNLFYVSSIILIAGISFDWIKYKFLLIKRHSRIGNS